MQNRVGKLIREARGEMTLSEFSKKVGVSSQTISRYEKGISPPNSKFPVRPTVKILLKIATGADIPIEELFSAALLDLRFDGK